MHSYQHFIADMIALGGYRKLTHFALGLVLLFYRNVEFFFLFSLCLTSKHNFLE